MAESSDLKWKIDKLLRLDTPVYETERILVALLLWTRTSEYGELWEVHSQLIPWILHWARISSSSPLFLRLFAQVYLHAHVERIEPRLEPLGGILLDAWKAMDVPQDVPAAVYKWLEQKQDRDEFLCELVLHKLILSDGGVCDDETNNTANNNNDDIQSDAETMFQETLRQLLDQNTSQCVSSQEWAALFWNETHTGGKISYWTPLLQWWIEHENHNETSRNDETNPRRVWAAVILETVMKQLAANDGENRMDWQVDKEVARKYAKFLMICAVDPNGANDSSIRTLAWSAIAMSVKASGWGWTLNSPSTSRLGKAHNMCTFIRLACGEWKIQLERSLQERMPADDNIITIQTCAQVLAHGFTYLQEIATGEDTQSSSFSPEALLHLRRSMEEAMHTTVEYLSTEDASKSLEISKTAACLFGPFLTEWDVFLEKNMEIMLNALAFSVDVSKDNLAVHNALLAGLTTVLASSEGDSSRIDSLNQFHLLGQRLEDFLISCFDQIKNNGEDTNQEGTLQWCSQIIDLWTSMVRDRKMTKLIESVRLCLQLVLAPGPIENNLDVSRLAFCYITLQGDVPPSNEDAALLKIALGKAHLGE